MSKPPNKKDNVVEVPRKRRARTPYPDRVILKVLSESEKPLSIDELGGKTESGPPTLLRNLRKLKRDNKVECFYKGRTSYYRIAKSYAHSAIKQGLVDRIRESSSMESSPDKGFFVFSDGKDEPFFDEGGLPSPKDAVESFVGHRFWCLSKKESQLSQVERVFGAMIWFGFKESIPTEKDREAGPDFYDVDADRYRDEGCLSSITNTIRKNCSSEDWEEVTPNLCFFYSKWLDLALALLADEGITERAAWDYGISDTPGAALGYKRMVYEAVFCYMLVDPHLQERLKEDKTSPELLKIAKSILRKPLWLDYAKGSGEEVKEFIKAHKEAVKGVLELLRPLDFVYVWAPMYPTRELYQLIQTNQAKAFDQWLGELKNDLRKGDTGNIRSHHVWLSSDNEKKFNRFLSWLRSGPAPSDEALRFILNNDVSFGPYEFAQVSFLYQHHPKGKELKFYEELLLVLKKAIKI